MGLPKLGASLNRMFLGIMVLNTSSWKYFSASSATWYDKLVRLSNMVNRIPAICSCGFSVCLMRLTVPSNWLARPARYAERVREGEADPEGMVDIIQGILTGRDGTED